MKLYASVTSERATEGQGGKELMIEITGEEKQVIARIKVTMPQKMTLIGAENIDYLVEVFPVAYPDVLKIGVKGHGYKLTRKIVPFSPEDMEHHHGRTRAAHDPRTCTNSTPCFDCEEIERPSITKGNKKKGEHCEMHDVANCYHCNP
jgi:hypothetical protein